MRALLLAAGLVVAGFAFYRAGGRCSPWYHAAAALTMPASTQLSRRPYVHYMPWFAVPVVFSIAAPTEEAALLLAEDQHAGELQELLDYPDVAASALGEDVDEDRDDAGLDRYLVAVTVTLDAGDERAARSAVGNAVGELDAVQHDFREVRDPAPASDPRLLSEETKRAIYWANDILGDQLREDAAALRAGEKFEDLIWLDQYLPSCFAGHYDADLVERFIEVVNGVAGKLASYPETYLATTAEELAAHALIEEAGGVVELHEDEFTKEQAAVTKPRAR
jgi:hypothetical protein